MMHCRQLFQEPHLLSLQIYLTACLAGMQLRQLPVVVTGDDPRDPGLQPHECAPAVLNELSMDSRLMKFLSSNNQYSSEMRIPRKFPLCKSLSDLEGLPIDIDGMLSARLNTFASSSSEFSESSDSKGDGNSSDSSADGSLSEFDWAEPPTPQRRIDRVDVLTSPRFLARRNAVADIKDTWALPQNKKKIRRQLSVPDGRLLIKLAATEAPELIVEAE